MAERAITSANIPKTYAELRKAVELTLILGQQEVEQAKVRTYWDTGRVIHEHVLLFKERADYGAGTIAQLSADMKYHRSTLQRCVQYYRAIPNCASMRNLTWAHYLVLIPIEDSKLRRTVAAEANRQEWTVAQLRERAAALAPSEAIDVVTVPAGEPQELLKPNRGTPGLHLIVERGPSTSLKAGDEGLAVDLGFKLYWPIDVARGGPLRNLKKGDIVRIASDDSLRMATEATKAELFTYAATLRRVVDGDTFVVALEVSPGVFLEQKLRLRGLDAPELSTPEGRAAKRFVDALVARTTAMVINTTKPDKYDRYLADVFLTTDAGEVFLNNELLGNGRPCGRMPRTSATTGDSSEENAVGPPVTPIDPNRIFFYQGSPSAWRMPPS